MFNKISETIISQQMIGLTPAYRLKAIKFHWYLK